MTPQDVGVAVSEHGARALGGTGGIVYALEGGDTLRVVGSWGYDPGLGAQYGVLALAADLPAPEAARERRTVTLDLRDEIAARYPGLESFGSFCAVPMLAGPELLGAVAVTRADTRAFLPAERELLEALGRVAGHALERASLYSRLNRLQATTADLARALTPHEVAATAAAQGAEALGASSAWVALLDESRQSLELAHAAGHPEGTVQRFRSLPLTAELPLAEAARTSTPVWLEGADAIFGRYPRFAEVRPQAQSAALLPLVEGGAALGAIGLVFDTPRTFGPADRDYLLTLTRLCGQALGRAQVYQSEHDLALTLQQALLPDGLPRAEGLELAVRYLPTADGVAAGGDFYDALRLTGGRLGIAVGDVVGHGPQAAAAMGQLRSALRAYAIEGRSPARVLQLLSRYVEGVPGARGATLVYAVIDPAARELRYASAGHPPPLLLAPGEEPRFLEGARGVPLDRTLGHVYADATASLAENGTLILYSDGVIERRGEALDHGLARLADAADGALDVESLADRLLGTVAARRTDDVALLVARVHVPEVAPLRLWFAARPDQLAVVREAMRGWLESAGVDRGDGEMLVLAAGELCANAVEHAYPEGRDGAVEVAMARDPGGTVSLVVRDRGRWRPPAVDPGDRGRGLAIVRALMGGGGVKSDPCHVVLWARYRPAGLAPPPAAAPGPALVEIERGPEVTVVRVMGEVDEFTVAGVEAALEDLGAEPVVVDLSRVAFIGSTGVRMLFALAERVARLVVAAPLDAPFRRALEVAELGRVAQLVEAWD
ncbi:SpoIIE family protein phosphatase [Solirubrobacter deserti]|uniref:SpoIIE family protein phosphatase n=1 Tax=Solirubrobacter deserti TaxID=2282478 RepID=A0ABT4RUB3_9ACTN|nr:SpoIIE family protein phosphatase [Solirubrobacter deserti]MDA0142155.1 SpoIIE family protein phosphatase [Solirubrobacter deserti]